MSESIWVAAITAASIVLVALVGLAGSYWQWVRKPREERAAQLALMVAEKEKADRLAHDEHTQKLNALLHQVQNSHTVNLRDDLDDKFGGLERRIGEKFAGVYRRMDHLEKRFDQHVDR